MPETISCPRCRRQLVLPAAQFGQPVQCPSCQHTFVGQPLAEPPPAVPYLRPVAIAQPLPELDPWRPAADDHLAHIPEVIIVQPHRGGCILTLGICSLLFALLSCVVIWLPLVSLGLSLVALSMSRRDLLAMAQGNMDAADGKMTSNGRLCAMIAAILAVLVFFPRCLVAINGLP
jgi:hypothetical protein